MVELSEVVLWCCGDGVCVCVDCGVVVVCCCVVFGGVDVD